MNFLYTTGLISLLLATETWASSWDQYEEKEKHIVSKEDDDYCFGTNNDRIREGERIEMKKCKDGEDSQCWDLKYRDKDDYDDELFRIHPCDDDDLCLEIDGDIEVEDNLKLRHCDKDEAGQYFMYDENDDSEFQAYYGYLCFEPKDFDKGDPIELKVCNGDREQKWKFENWKKSKPTPKPTHKPTRKPGPQRPHPQRCQKKSVVECKNCCNDEYAWKKCKDFAPSGSKNWRKRWCVDEKVECRSDCHS